MNQLRNPAFARGKVLPTFWTWSCPSPDVVLCPPSQVSAGLELTAKARFASPARLFQQIRCKSRQFYRVEAVVSCDLNPFTPSVRNRVLSGVATSVTNEAGLLVGAGFQGADEAHPTWHWSYPILIADRLTIRNYYQAPSDATRLTLCLQLSNALGTVKVHEVRVIPILDLETESHPLAIPPPWNRSRPLKVCSSVAVMAPNDSLTARGLGEILKVALGEKSVALRSLQEWSNSTPLVDLEDALIFPSPDRPPGIRTVKDLFKLARDRIVILSLPAFSSLTKQEARLRRIEQPDDPMHARVEYSTFATRGFALHDVVPYAWSGAGGASFVQQQFRATPRLQSLYKRLGLHVLLSSMCDKDSTSHQPIALFKATESGALFVIDLEPVVDRGSTLGEPTLAARILLGMLGQGRLDAGQYFVPWRNQEQFEEFMREINARMDCVHIEGLNGPMETPNRYRLSIGHEDQYLGLPPPKRPVLLFRSGWACGEYDTVIAVWTWLKQLLRPPQRDHAATRSLLREARPIWLPIMHTKSPENKAAAAKAPDPKLIAAVIDVLTAPLDRPQIRLFQRIRPTPAEQRLIRSSQMPAPRHFCLAPPATRSGHPRDRSRAWEWRTVLPEVVIEANEPTDDYAREIFANGGCVFTLTLPKCGMDAVARSIEMTDVAAHCIDRVVRALFP